MAHDEDIEITPVRPTVAIVGSSRIGTGLVLSIAMTSGAFVLEADPHAFEPLEKLMRLPRRLRSRDRVINFASDPAKIYFESEVQPTKRKRRRNRGKRA